MVKLLDKTKFIQAKEQGLNNKQSAIQAGSNPKAAKQAGYRLSKQLAIDDQVNKAIRQLDITVKKTLQPIADGLTATKLIVHNGGNEAEGWTEEVIDHSTRLKASSMAQDLLGIKQRKQNTSELPSSLFSAETINIATKAHKNERITVDPNVQNDA